MRALLVQTWPPFAANGRDPTRGWALGTLFLEFDELARPIRRRINHTAVAALPISIRPALLVGLSRAIGHPDVLDAIRNETIFRERAALNAYAKKPGSSPMQQEKAIQCEKFLGYIFSL